MMYPSTMTGGVPWARVSRCCGQLSTGPLDEQVFLDVCSGFSRAYSRAQGLNTLAQKRLTFFICIVGFYITKKSKGYLPSPEEGLGQGLAATAQAHDQGCFLEFELPIIQ